MGDCVQGAADLTGVGYRKLGQLEWVNHVYVGAVWGCCSGNVLGRGTLACMAGRTWCEELLVMREASVAAVLCRG